MASASNQSGDEFDDDDGYDCAGCDEPNSVDKRMVSCDKCSAWYHLKCAGETPGVDKRPWHCAKCPPVKTKRTGEGDADSKSNASRRSSRRGAPGKVDDVNKGPPENPETPLKNPEVQKPVSKKAKSVRSTTSSVLARNQLAKKRLEEERKLSEEVLAEEERRLIEDRAIQIRERLLRKKKLDMKKKYAEELLALEETAIDDEEEVSVTLSKRGRAWLEDQRKRSLNIGLDDLEDEIPEDPLPQKEDVDPEVPEGEENEDDPAKPDGEENEDDSAIPGGEENEDDLEDDPEIPEEVEDENNPAVPEKVTKAARPRVSLPAPPTPQPRPANKPKVNPRPNPVPAPAAVETEFTLTASQIATRKVWPKKLPTFTGVPEEWPIFISTFELGNKMCGFTNVDNIVRLRECLGGEAKVRVGSKLMFPDNVPVIIETLRRFYGQPRMVVKSLAEKVSKLEAPGPEDLEGLRDFGIAVVQLCDHLVAANLRNHLANPSLMDDLVEKLPAVYKLQWVSYQRTIEEPTLKDFGEFMDALVADISEVINSKKKTKPEKPKPSQKGHVHAHSSPEAKDGSNRQPCPVCGKTDHRPWKCEKFLQMGLKSRTETVEKAKLCKICLMSHGDWRCRSKIRCKIDGCSESHNPLLHPPKMNSPQRTVTGACNAHGQVAGEVLFKIIPITLHNGDRSFNTFAFLDEGSSLTLIEASVAKALGLNGVAEPLRLVWTSNVARTERSSKRVDVTVSARDSQQQYSLKDAHTVKELNLPRQSVASTNLGERFGHLKNLPVHSYVNAEPKVLIGLQNLDLFAPLETRIGQPGDPVAVRSLLGWAVYGPSGCVEERRAFLGLHDCQRVIDDELNELMRQQFVLEEAVVCATPLPESEDDMRAWRILDQTTRRIGDRFETGLIWNCDDVHFPDSRPMAMSRMKALETKLARDHALRENVYQQIRDYVAKGYIHIATEEELLSADPDRIWYLPVNVVVHPKKPEKKRLVWDARARVNGVSLNSMLSKGPDLLRKLPKVICTFRERPVGFGGDVEEMFHQVRIIPKDKNSQRFIFRFNPNQEPDVYIMDVATFGATCSPCSVQHVMHKNARESAEEFPDAAAAIIEKTYMDDYFDSADTPEEAAQRAVEVRSIHARAGFKMRNWVSNCGKVLDALGEKRSQKPLAIRSESHDGWERVLGVVWNPIGDFFSFSTKFRDDLVPYATGERWPTKRDVARCVMSLFDPTGLLAPYLIHGKMLIQDLWRSGTQWDQLIPDEVCEKWKNWLTLLPGIASLQIPRHYFGGSTPSRFRSLELHMFTDASELAYGAAAYFRAIDDEGVHCVLVMAKSKVASIKYQSIPRRELDAAALGARLAARIQEYHSLSITSLTLWTDSRTVLSWISSDGRKYAPYIGNRLGVIHTHTNPQNWRWVPSKENVADCLTKWGKDTEPDIDSRWFRGPSFLQLPEENWPQQPKIAAGTVEDLRPKYQLHHTTIPEPLHGADRVSKWNVLVRSVAFTYRFIRNCRLKMKGQPIETVKAVGHQAKFASRATATVDTPITQSEYEKAEHYLWRTAQADQYPDEVVTLLKNREMAVESLQSIDKSNPLYNASPFADEFGVLRVDGRTVNAGYATFDARFPVLLPKKHRITFLILDHYHRKFGHANTETVANEVRQRYDIPSLRSRLRTVMRECQRCAIQRCRPQPPRMAPLPEQRLTPYIRPFTNVGIDYLGPLEVTVGRRKEKRYVVVFTCLVVRAVHLEVAHNLSTDSCIMAIRRFVRAYGAPAEIFTDNGTNFVGASRELLREIKRINTECADTFTDAKTKWSFNPPSAPHMGGVWERMVRSVKETMRAIDDGRKLNDEILLTVLAETKWFINSRPLTYKPQQSSESEALTPNHFILWGSSSGINEPLRTPVDLAEALRSSYKRSQYLANSLWKRWLKEYFPTLNKRSKWFEDTPAVRVGDLVYVAEGNRRTWIRATVEEVFPGRDGVVRQAAVRTCNDQRLLRPVVKLAVLEIKDEESGK